MPHSSEPTEKLLSAWIQHLDEAKTFPPSALWYAKEQALVLLSEETRRKPREHYNAGTIAQLSLLCLYNKTQAPLPDTTIRAILHVLPPTQHDLVDVAALLEQIYINPDIKEHLNHEIHATNNKTIRRHKRSSGST